MLLKKIEKKEFDNFRNNFDYNFYQNGSWAEIKKINGWKSEYVGVFENDEPILICMILMRKIGFKYFCYSPRGPLVRDDICNKKHAYEFFLKNIKPLLKKEKGFIFKIDPYIEMRKRNRAGEIVGDWNNEEFVEYLKQIGCKHNGFTIGYSKDIQFRWSYALDIKDKSVEDLWNDMNQRCKRSIKKAEKFPLVVKEVNKINLNDFKGIMEHTASRHQHADRDVDYYLKIKEELKDDVKIAIIYLDKSSFIEGIQNKKYEIRENVYKEVLNDNKELIPLSAGVFILDRNRMNYVYGGTYSKYFPFMAQYKMQMEMIKFSIEKKLSFYDFGGIKGVFDKDSPDYKLYDYKRGYGGFVIEYIGEFNIEIDKMYLSIYNKMFFIYKRIRSLLP